MTTANDTEIKILNHAIDNIAKLSFGKDGERTSNYDVNIHLNGISLWERDVQVGTGTGHITDRKSYATVKRKEIERNETNLTKIINAKSLTDLISIFN